MKLIPGILMAVIAAVCAIAIWAASRNINPATMTTSAMPAATPSVQTTTRNGFAAVVVDFNCGGVRPVRAIIKGDGADYSRFYTADGHENENGTPSPYDLISCK